MFKEKIQKLLTRAFADVGVTVPEITVDSPTQSVNGDYASNVALVAAKKLGRNPMELAQEIQKKLEEAPADFIAKIEVARPGFINFWIKEEALVDGLKNINKKLVLKTPMTGKKVLVEFAHPNTHKAFHIGHLRNIITGESIVRLLESAGAEVIRANYQGDVGMHIAKCIQGLTMLLGEGKVDTKDLVIEDSSNDVDRVLCIVKALNKRDIHERIALLGEAYAYGSKLFEENGVATAAIKEINKSIYNDNWGIYKPYKEVYQVTRQWSLDYFEMIYKRVNTHFDRLYFESETYEPGRENVRKGLVDGVFQKSEGAIIFPGSKYELHDRVFITSEGNPTYEGKDMGLAPLQHKEYHPDLIIHVLGPEQYGYTRVIFKALDLLFPEDAGKQLHLVYGWVKLKHGKMSSRTGNVILGEWLLDEAKKKILGSYKVSEEIAEQVAVGAVKYSFLKVGLNQEIAFDLEESISLEGNSGPYLQYTFARIQSVLQKGNLMEENLHGQLPSLNSEERALLKLLAQYQDVVTEAAVNYAPNILATYLFDLAQAFNLFYQKCPILKAEEDVKSLRLLITKSAGETIKSGLYLLGIKAPEQM